MAKDEKTGPWKNRGGKEEVKEGHGWRGKEILKHFKQPQPGRAVGCSYVGSWPTIKILEPVRPLDTSSVLAHSNPGE